MKLSNLLGLSLVTIFFANFANADCTALFNELHSYVQPPTIGHCQPPFNTLHVKMATNRNDTRYVSFAEGETVEKIEGGGRFPLNPSFGGTMSQSFSDRIKNIYEPPCNAGEFCFPTYQPFSVSAMDQLGMTFYNGSVTLTLKTWGNGKVKVPLECTPSGMMYGETEGTIFSFSFKKTVYENPCIH